MTLLAIFFSTLIADVLWTYYIRRTSQGHALSAAVFSLLIALLGGVITLGYIREGWLVLIPTGAGAFLGTFLSVRLDAKR